MSDSTVVLGTSEGDWENRQVPIEALPLLDLLMFTIYVKFALSPRDGNS